MRVTRSKVVSEKSKSRKKKGDTNMENINKVVELNGVTGCSNCPLAYAENCNDPNSPKKCAITGSSISEDDSIMCPCLTKDTYDKMIIDSYLKNHKDDKSDSTDDEEEGEDFETKSINAGLGALNNICLAMQAQVSNRNLTEDQAQTVVWGALLLLHNMHPDKVPVEFLYQLLGSFAARKFAPSSVSSPTENS